MPALGADGLTAEMRALREACEVAAHKLGELHEDGEAMRALAKAAPELAQEIRETVADWRAAGDAFLRSLVRA